MTTVRGASILFAIGIGFSAACGVAHADDTPQIRYEVSGSSPVADYVSYQTDTGQYHQATVQMPWSTEFTSFGGEVLIVSAQAPGTITCKIFKDGNVVKEATANGAPARTVCTL